MSSRPAAIKTPSYCGMVLKISNINLPGGKIKHLWFQLYYYRIHAAFGSMIRNHLWWCSKRHSQCLVYHGDRRDCKRWDPEHKKNCLKNSANQAVSGEMWSVYFPPQLLFDLLTLCSSLFFALFTLRGWH